MSIDWSLQEDNWKYIEHLQTAEVNPVKEDLVETELVHNLHNRARVRGHTFDSDEPEAVVGGSGQGPSPLEYFLAGFGFCQQVIHVRNALASGIEIDDISMEVSGHVDPRAVFGIGDHEPGFVDDTIGYTTYIESPAPREEVAELVEMSEEYCPAHATLRKPMTLERTVVVNGDPLD